MRDEVRRYGFSGGVNAQRIDDRTVRVSGRGNGYADPVTIKKFVLLKSADETLVAGSDISRLPAHLTHREEA